MDTIRVADYIGRPLKEIVFPDGETWKVRQPLEADYYRMTAEEEAHNARVRAYRKKALARARKLVSDAKAKAAEAEEHIRAGSPEDPDEAARILIDAQGDKEARPLQAEPRYMQASRLAIFIEPPQTPETILEKLGPHIINLVELMVLAVFRGDTAKKELEASTDI